jgi:hypothetical protein
MDKNASLWMIKPVNLTSQKACVLVAVFALTNVHMML